MAETPLDDENKKHPWRRGDAVNERPEERRAPQSQILHLSDEELGLDELDAEPLEPSGGPVALTKQPTLEDLPTPSLPRRGGQGLVKVSSDRFKQSSGQRVRQDSGEQSERTASHGTQPEEPALVPLHPRPGQQTPQASSRLAVISRTDRHRQVRQSSVEDNLEGRGSARAARTMDPEHVVPPQLQLEAPSRVRVRMVDKIAPDPGLVVMTDPGSIGAEQYRVLSLKLKEHEALRVMAVLSPTKAADGCLAAANVALALAEGSRSQVVLLDTNLRSNQVGDLFGLLTVSEDLGQQLSLHKRNPDAPWEVLSLGSAFHVIPATVMNGNPAAMLNSETMWELMNELRQHFDYIVITAPPVMAVADGVIMQDHVDGTLLVARAGRSRAEAMRESLKRLGEGKVLGTVLLDVKRSLRI